MSPQELQSVQKAVAELSERLTRLEDLFLETDRCVAHQLFGPVDGEPVTGDTLHERVESLEKVISNGEIKILIGGLKP